MDAQQLGHHAEEAIGCLQSHIHKITTINYSKHVEEQRQPFLDNW